jgi:hypothetical protein
MTAVNFDNVNTSPDDDDASRIATHNWPDLKPEAFQGITGEIIAAVMPHTEADPAAVLVTLLTAFGAIAGLSPYALAGNEPHPGRLHTLIVGRTSDGGKGTSWAAVKAILAYAYLSLYSHILGGIVSGEGIIENVRDPRGEPESKNYDEGVTDKRLLVVETEFSAALAKGARQGSSLFPVLRQAWDGGTLQSAARSANALRATNPHISLIGHITPGEFREKLSEGEMAGGTINRLLMVLSRRSKLLPEGGNLPDAVIRECGAMLTDALAAADSETSLVIQRTISADELWRDAYPKLVAPKPDGWYASATARAQAQVLRLSVIYATLDQSKLIKPEHLRAALAVWDYCDASAKVLFAEAEHDSRRADTDKILKFIGGRGKVTRNQLSEELFQKNKKSYEIDALLRPLIDAGLVSQESEETRGRPRTVYTLRDKRDNGIRPVTSENSADFPRLSRNPTGKVSGTNPQLSGVIPLIPLIPPDRDGLQPDGIEPSPVVPGDPTLLTPGQTDRVQQALEKARRPPLCPGCSRAPARTDTGLCDLCTVKASKQQDGAQ